ncbi:MAG TPA: hypothetical protein VLV54_08235 [Thermoanaerobaculia bacterium]|nr:hypothetical protein [Thermoanaerobaculia bacterium]
MTRDEYEQHKRRLDEELRTGVELLETAHQYQLRALQLVWVVVGGDGVEIPPLPAVALSPVASKPLPTVPALPAPLPAPPKPARRGPWELHNDVVDALENVPEIFTRNDICQVIGYEPDRGSLYRVLQGLIEEGVVVIEQTGSGKWPTRYRKAAASNATAGG